MIKIKTPINELILFQEKLCHALTGAGPILVPAPNLIDKEFFPKGAGNVLVIITEKPLLMRGGHYHKTVMENVSQISGSSLWYFLDMRKNSSTYGTECLYLVGRLKGDTIIQKYITEKIEDSFFSKESDILTTIQTPPGIYHVVWSASNQASIFTEIKSNPYEENDYVRITPKDIQKPILDSLLKSISNTKI